MNDNVNHPSHYAEGCSLECIDVMEAVFGDRVLANYCTVNAFKYLWRYKNKNGAEDIKKAEWYLARAHHMLEERDFIGMDSEIYERVNALFHKVVDKEEHEEGIEDGEVQ